MSNKNQKSLKQMAAIVLNEKGPLHSKLIWKEIAQQGYVSNGKSPDATIAAHIYMDIKNNGNNSIFVKTGPNTFDLRNKTAITLQSSVEEEVISSLVDMLLTGIKKTIRNLRSHV